MIEVNTLSGPTGPETMDFEAFAVEDPFVLRRTSLLTHVGVTYILTKLSQVRRGHNQPWKNGPSRRRMKLSMQSPQGKGTC